MSKPAVPHRLRGTFWPAQWSVKAKLILTSLVPLIVLLPIVMGLLAVLGNQAYNRILSSKLQSDLAIASQYFDRIEDNHRQSLKAFASSERLARAVRLQQDAALDTLIAEIKQTEQYSYLVFKDLSGRPRGLLYARSAQHDPDLDMVYDKALEAGSASGLTSMTAQALSQYDPALALASRLDLVYTPNASPDERREETRGLVLQSAARVMVDGKTVGVLEAGTLLNRNLSLIERINHLVYPTDSLLLGSLGTATLFLGDVRIATTVRDATGDIALGTRVSADVREKVLGRGEMWLEKAFVVNDWYMSGYQPLSNLAGYRVGMLYVGFLEAPYKALKDKIVWGLLIGGLAAALLGVWLVSSLTKGIFDPLLRMNNTMSRVETGDDLARVGDLKRADEFAQLASHFDELLDRLASRQTDLIELNRALDERVSARTADLVLANDLLRQAQAQLLSSEKLATMGQLTAGLAHEINNPLAVMQGHLDLLAHGLIDRPDGAQGDSFTAQQEIRLLDEQIQRMRVLVEKLLQFARPDTYVGYAEPLDVNVVIRDSLVLVDREIKQSGAELLLDLQARAHTQVSRTELQQVLVNVLINAAHAVGELSVSVAPGRVPRISIATEDVQVDGEPAVQIAIVNNGPAIEPDKLAVIFELFYTTKRQQGTGLGLPVSRMLVERYGGALTVHSPVNTQATEPYGARFLVTLRCQARYSSDMIRAAIFKTQQSGAVTLGSGSDV